MNIKLLGIDLAKKSFQLHGVDSSGKAVLRRKLKRSELLNFIANLPQCIIAIEACSSANYWHEEFTKLGHEVKQIAPQFVKPYVKTNKNDAADAEAIAEAASRPEMRFVEVKKAWQRDVQALHRNRTRLIKSRTALLNSIHGFLSEYGLSLTGVMVSKKRFLSELREILSSHSLPAQFTDMSNFILREMHAELESLEKHIRFYDEQIISFAARTEDCKRIQTIPGVGVLTATAMIAAVGNAHQFKNGRDLSAWVGLVPRQHSTGGKDRLLSISKRGDGYLRCLLVHGARSVLRTAEKKEDKMSIWALKIAKNRGMNKAIVAVANKNARIICSIIKKGENYQPVYEQAA
jgi:transposase